MKILIIHHHLKPGGVTRIIQSQINSLLSSDIEIEILTGYIDTNDVANFGSVPIHIHPELDYTFPENYTQENTNSQIQSIKKIIQTYATTNDVLHIHNLNLGKNPAVTLAAYMLLQDGYKIFHHCHDFSEDRPKNYDFLKNVIQDIAKYNLTDVLYPTHPNYHIGVLNRNDYDRLTNKVDGGALYLLPNPVEITEANKSSSGDKIRSVFSIDPGKIIVTYPVRVIKRKNIGELILIASLHKETADFLVTLPPKNPQEIVHYDKWISFCKNMNITNIHFEAGLKMNFEEIIAGSDFCISTSIREGFGMTFLEPWLQHTPVIGRSIQEIISDFEQSNITFPSLYHEVSVEGYDKDFALLEDDEQRSIIKKVLTNTEFSETVFIQNQKIANLLNPISKDITDTNYNTIKKEFSIESYGEGLQRIYQTLLK